MDASLTKAGDKVMVRWVVGVEFTGLGGSVYAHCYV